MTRIRTTRTATVTAKKTKRVECCSVGAGVRPAACRSQAGFVLITGMVVLLMVTLVSLSSMRMTGMQERMTANQRHKTISLMAAEAGGSLAIQAHQKATTTPWWSALPATTPALLTAAGLDGHAGHWRLAHAERLTQSRALTQTVQVQGYAIDSAGNVLSESTIEFQIQGQAGILSDESIQVNGSASINGSAHSNGHFTVTSNGSQNAILNGKVTASGNVGFSGSNVPSTAKQSNAAQRDLASEIGRVSDATNFGRTLDSATFSACGTLPQDLQGATRYCLGSVDLPNNLHNGTLYVKGDVTSSGNLSQLNLVVDGSFTQQGGSTWGTGSQTAVNVAATGNITFSGGGNLNLYGSLWTDGNLVRNGGGQAVITGSGIVSWGSQTWNGNLTYVGPGVGASTVTQWRELN